LNDIVINKSIEFVTFIIFCVAHKCTYLLTYDTYRDEGVRVANNAFNVGSRGADDRSNGVVWNSDVTSLTQVGVRCRRRGARPRRLWRVERLDRVGGDTRRKRLVLALLMQQHINRLVKLAVLSQRCSVV